MVLARTRMSLVHKGEAYERRDEVNRTGMNAVNSSEQWHCR